MREFLKQLTTKSACERWKERSMISNHSRRLDKLEEVSRPKGGVVRIWDNHTPGCVERQKARLIASGSLGPEDEIVVYCWQR
jgi:hypothetical protein